MWLVRQPRRCSGARPRSILVLVILPPQGMGGTTGES
jgi:hypothetical protein